MTVPVVLVGQSAMAEAVRALELLAEVSGEVRDLLLDLLESGDEFAAVDQDTASRWAGELCLRLKPGQGLLERLTAIRALDFKGRVLIEEVRHGWPILSLAGGPASVAEAGGVSSPARGAAA